MGSWAAPETILTIADKPLPAAKAGNYAALDSEDVSPILPPRSSIHRMASPAPHSTKSILSEALTASQVERTRMTREMFRPADLKYSWWQAAPCPPPRSRHTATSVNDGKVVVFGGLGSLRKGTDAHCFADLWTLDTVTLRWHEHSNVVGDVPPPRYGHSATFIPDMSMEPEGSSSVAMESSSESDEEGSAIPPVFERSAGDARPVPGLISFGPSSARPALVIFGGRTADHKLLNDIHILHLHEMRWEKVDTPSANQPPPCFLHSASRLTRPAALAACGSEHTVSIAVFGGRTETHAASRAFHVLDLTSRQWLVPALAGDPPRKRAEHFSFMHGGNFLVICGGNNRFVSLHDDVWAVNWSKMCWIHPRLKKSPKPSKGTQLPPYWSLVGNKLFSFQYDHLQHSTVSYLDVDDFTWKFGQVTGSLPLDPLVTYSLTTVIDSQLFINLSSPNGQIVALVNSAPDFQSSLALRFRWRDFELTLPDYPVSFGLDPAVSSKIEIEVRHSSRRPDKFDFPDAETTAAAAAATASGTAMDFGPFQLLVHRLTRKHGLGNASLLYYDARKARYLVVGCDRDLEMVAANARQRMPVGTAVLYLAAARVHRGAEERSERLNFLVRAAEGLEQSRVDAASSFTGYENTARLYEPKPMMGAGDGGGGHGRAGTRSVHDEELDEGSFFQIRVNESKPSRPMTTVSPQQYMDEEDLPFQMVYQPARPGLLRRIHDRLIKLEQRGLSWAFLRSDRSRAAAAELSSSPINEALGPQPWSLVRSRAEFGEDSAFSWSLWLSTFLRILLLPLYSFYLLLLGWMKYSIPAIVLALVASIYPLVASMIPAASYLLYPSSTSSLTRVFAFGPLFIWLMFALIVSTINASWVDVKGQTRKLRRYRARIRPHVGAHGPDTGFSITTAEDLMFSITSKEQNSPDKPGVIINCVIFALIGAGVYSVASVVGLIFIDGWVSSPGVLHGPDFYFFLILTEIMNFVGALAFYFVLGVCLAIFQRQLLMMKFFGELTQEHTKQCDSAHLPLSDTENIMCWMKLRDYLVKHEFLPLGTADIVLGWTLAFTFLLWIVIIVKVFYFYGQVGRPNALFSGFNVMLLCNLLVLSSYVAAALLLGGSISAQKVRHFKVLQKERVKLILAHQHDKILYLGGSNSIDQITLAEQEATLDLLDTMLGVIDKQPAFRVLGMALGETGLRVTTAILVPITIAVVTRMLAEVARTVNSSSG
ncbi:MAG: kelch repeat-containing protein [archaeon]|nr:kelch repeat-containing protein [archaeon]